MLMTETRSNLIYAHATKSSCKFFFFFRIKIFVGFPPHSSNQPAPVDELSVKMLALLHADIPDVPESVDGSLRVPALNDVRLMQTQQRFHRFLCHVRHWLLVDERNEAVDQLQGTALNLMARLAWILLCAHDNEVATSTQKNYKASYHPIQMYVSILQQLSDCSRKKTSKLTRWPNGVSVSVVHCLL